MARVRSPNYPAIGLQEGIDRIRKVHEQQNRTPELRDVVAMHLGYNSLNGAALKVLSALIKYGLFENAGEGQLQVSDRAIRILFPENDSERVNAIKEAAVAPKLFADINERWDDKVPTDESLRAYLIRRQFANSAIDSVIQSYKGTFDLVARESEGYDSSTQEEIDEEPMTSELAVDSLADTPPPISREGDPYTFGFTPSGGIEVRARLTEDSQVDDLIRSLEAMKLLFRPASSFRRPDPIEDDETAN